MAGGCRDIVLVAARTQGSATSSSGPLTERMTTPRRTPLLHCPAPAKVNLFLHVTGRRSDGYHLLETVFQLIDLFDWLDFEPRDDGLIVASSGDWPMEQDLTVRAARLLRQTAGASDRTDFGVTIRVDKQIPVGGGLGGGSSDAATTLLALNQLWQLHWPVQRLAELSVALGADVPMFVRGHNAYALGIGEELQPIALPARHFIVVQPPVEVQTAVVFADPNLTRNTKPLTLAGFAREQSTAAARLPGHNDLQKPVLQRFPAVADALSVLLEAAATLGVDPSAVRMSGSGACVFAATESSSIAAAIAEFVSGAGVGRVHRCASLQRHPMIEAVAQ
jgi:4-diphosphocytidyl-2-C-methyl-D-erythritol kinase